MMRLINAVGVARGLLLICLSEAYDIGVMLRMRTINGMGPMGRGARARGAQCCLLNACARNFISMYI